MSEFLCPTDATAQGDDTSEKQNIKIGKKLAPYNPTNHECVTMALDMLSLRPEGELLYDLGCGDARLLIEACRRFPGLKGVGVEYDAEVLMKARAAITTAISAEDNETTNHLNLIERIELIHANVLDVDISNATAFFIYLVPEGMKLLAPTLINLINSGRGIRIVSYVFSIPGLTPKQTMTYKKSTNLYLYHE